MRKKARRHSSASVERSGASHSRDNTTVKLPIFYCVGCGAHTMPPIPLCIGCGISGRSLPAIYSENRRYHCVFCSAPLDRYHDFHADGSFKNEDYLCIGCANAEKHLLPYNRPYLQKAVKYLTDRLKSDELLPHVRWTYQKHLEHFSASKMLS